MQQLIHSVLGRFGLICYAENLGQCRMFTSFPMDACAVLPRQFKRAVHSRVCMISRSPGNDVRMAWSACWMFCWSRRTALTTFWLRQTCHIATMTCCELVSEWSNVGDRDRWSRSCLWGAVSTIDTFQPLSILMSPWSRIGRQGFYTCHHPLHRRFFGSTRGLEAWCWGMNAICLSSTGNEELEVPSSWGILSSPAWQVPNFLNIWKLAWTDLSGKVYLDGVLSLVDSYNMLSYLGKRKAPDWSYHTGNLRW